VDFFLPTLGVGQFYVLEKHTAAGVNQFLPVQDDAFIGDVPGCGEVGIFNGIVEMGQAFLVEARFLIFEPAIFRFQIFAV